MTIGMKNAPRRSAIPAALFAAALLGGCASGHVGESWQCPLAEGGTCDSVAAADPAVPDAGAAHRSVLAEPLWRVRAAGTGDARPEMAAEAPCEAACGGFDPFGWLARLFGGGGEDEPSAEMETPAGETAAPSPAPPAEPAAAALPAEPEAAERHADGEYPPADDLRTDEVVARIWIAPFVDADGVYREASHVRVVLEPAGWRLAR